MKINIHNSTYIFILLTFLAGYFEYIFLLLLIIIIHEGGHYIFGLIEGIKASKIEVYPFGGCTIFDSELNISIKKEFFCLIGGLVFQLIFFYLVYKLYLNGYVKSNTYFIFKKINILLLSFNFMPILPLDGGKLLNLILDLFFSYKLSNILSIIISLIFIVIFALYNKTFFAIVLSIFLIKNIVLEYMNIKIKYNKFLLERYLYNYDFKKIKIVNNINLLYRDYTHIINNSFESKILRNIFDRTS